MKSIIFNEGIFHIDTLTSSYSMKILDTGHLSHIWYGDRYEAGIGEDLIAPAGHAGIGSEVSYDEEHPHYLMNNIMLECSAPGKGDFRDQSCIVRYGNGITTLDFLYESHEILESRPALPRPHADGKGVETLIITMKDRVLPIWLKLEYAVYPEHDIIVRSSELINGTDDGIRIEKLASSMLDLPDSSWDIITLGGAWAREKHETRRPLTSGKIVNASSAGPSTIHADPYLAVVRPETTEHTGEIIASTLIWSGPHEESAEVSPYDRVRLMTGLDTSTLSYPLMKGESFRTPDAVLTHSENGIEGAAKNFSGFIRERVMRSTWKDRERPILLNNWEATYFWFTEEKIISLIDEAADLGMELFVLDDGWFGKRDNDTTSLGDWFLYEKKLPHGIKALSDHAHEKGLMFGIWVEPEMVSIDSDLYRAHPDWMVAIPGREPAPGRHQYVLDMTRDDVREYLLEVLSKVTEEGNVDYMKWDMNRAMSDIWSSNLRDQGEFMYRYTLGLYDLLDKFTSRYPDLLLESCASGGTRYDMGIMAFSPQIWTSDDTDAYMRTIIQKGTMRWSPQSAMGAHVSAVPNHQSHRVTDIGTRFDVASMGVLGYELDVTKLSDEDKAAIKEQTAFYKKWRKLLQFGDLSFIPTRDINRTEWYVTDGTCFIAVTFQTINHTNYGITERLVLREADPRRTYRIRERGTPEEEWSITVSGSILKTCGAALPDKLTGKPGPGHIRRMGDFSSRMYIAEPI